MVGEKKLVRTGRMAFIDCIRCGAKVAKTSNVQKYCPECRNLVNVECTKRRNAIRGVTRREIRIIKTCSVCGNEFRAASGTSKRCHDCVREEAEARKTMREAVSKCVRCGKQRFSTNPKALYCAECKKDVKRESNIRYLERKHTGNCTNPAIKYKDVFPITPETIRYMVIEMRMISTLHVKEMCNAGLSISQISDMAKNYPDYCFPKLGPIGLRQRVA